MENNSLNLTVEYKPLHPLTEKVLSVLGTKGPLKHSDLIAISGDLRQYANVQIQNRIAIK